MRVRIIKPPSGIIDGIHVSLFKPNAVYDLPAALASCLIVEGWAEPEMRAHRPEYPGANEVRDVRQPFFAQEKAADKKN